MEKYEIWLGKYINSPEIQLITHKFFCAFVRKKAKIRQIVGQSLNLFDDTQTFRIRHFQTAWKSMKFNNSKLHIYRFP